MHNNLTKKIKSTFLATTILAESMLSTVSLANPTSKCSADSDQATTPATSLFRMPTKAFAPLSRTIPADIVEGTHDNTTTTQSAIAIRCPNLSPNSNWANPEHTKAILSGHLPTAETKSSSAEVPTSKEITVESSKKETAAIIQEKATPSSTIPSDYSEDEHALIVNLNHIRHTLKEEKEFVDFCENIHKSMNQRKSSNFNKWCLSTLIKILELQPESTQIKNKIIEAYNRCKEWSCFDKDDFSDPTLLYRALSFLNNNKKANSIIEEIIIKYIKKLMTDSEFKNLNSESCPSYYKLNMIRCLSLCFKLKKLNQGEIKKHCNQIDISKIQKEPAKIYRKALLCFGQIPHNATNQLSALHALVGSSEKDFVKAAKGDEISRDALLALGKISHNTTIQLAALNSLVGSSPKQFAAAAKNGDDISRDALLALGKIPHNYTEKLAALHALVGSSPEQFAAAAKNGDDISRDALLALGKIPHNTTIQLAALHSLVGSSHEQFVVAANGDDISRGALLTLGKIPSNPNRLVALHALVCSSPKQFAIAANSDKISKDDLLASEQNPD